jgi:hypothetical protein
MPCPGCYFITIAFWLRVRTRALRAPIFLGSYTQNGPLLAPPTPPLTAASLLLIHPLNIKNVFCVRDLKQRPYNIHLYVYSSVGDSGGQSHTNCTPVATSRMQIVPQWPPVAGKFLIYSWRPRRYNLHATGGHPFVCDWCWPLGYHLYATGPASRYASFACVSGQYSSKPPISIKYF